MKVDEASTPFGKHVKVRCPHCKGIGLAEHQRAPAAPPTWKAPPTVGPAKRITERVKYPDLQSGGPEVLDEPLPSDAFKDFRFPSEQTERRTGATVPKRRRNIVWLLAASLGTVLFFAALVNIILQGPTR